MRFTVSSTALSNKLTALSRVINSRNALQILGDFMFVTEGKQLHITASDGENTLSTTIELADSDTDDAFAIDSHNLLEAVKGFSEQPLTIEVDKMGKLANIIYQNGHFALPTDNVEEYPKTLGITEDATEITLPCGMLYDNISRSLFATAQDELRPVMNGLYFDLTADCLAIVATDGHKLVRNRNYSIKTAQPTAFILPKKPASLLKNMLGKEGNDVNIKFNERTAVINFDENELICRLIEGRYPNYNAVIPQSNSNIITVDRNGMLSALKRVAPFANDASNLIKFTIADNTLTLDAEDYDFSKTASEKLACDYNGKPMSIGFKGSSFIEVLSNFTCDDVVIKLADPGRAGLVMPAEQNEGTDEEVMMLLMPMLIE